MITYSAQDVKELVRFKERSSNKLIIQVQHPQTPVET